MSDTSPALQPPEIKAFTDKALSTSFEHLGQVLTGFQFTFAKVGFVLQILQYLRSLSFVQRPVAQVMLQGDFYHWVPLFNYLDDYFEKCLQPRQDLQLDVAAGQPQEPFPVEQVNAILDFSATVLENCSNKHLYGSHDVSPFLQYHAHRSFFPKYFGRDLKCLIVS